MLTILADSEKKLLDSDRRLTLQAEDDGYMGGSPYENRGSLSLSLGLSLGLSLSLSLSLSLGLSLSLSLSCPYYYYY